MGMVTGRLLFFVALVGVGGAARAAPGEVAEADARALVARWLAAQNGGDFVAYDALYAADFQGVLRVGQTARTLDRAAWMKSRKKMLKKQAQVSAADIKVSPAAGQTEVRLTQTFTAARFKDVGEKKLVLRMVGDQVRIVGEEMLSSNVVGQLVRAKGDLSAAEVPAALLRTLRKKHKTGKLSLRWGRKLELAAGAGMALVLTEAGEDGQTEAALVLAVVTLSGGVPAVAASARTAYGPRELALFSLPDDDIDGDGRADLFLYMDTGFIEGYWSELFPFLTRQPAVGAIGVNSGGGEGTYQDSIASYLCLTSVGGAPAWVAVTHISGEDVDGEFSREGLVLYLQRGSVIDTPRRVFARQLASDKREQDLLARWRAAVGAPAAEPRTAIPPTHIERCQGGAQAAFLVGGGVVRGKGAAWRLVSGLALSKDAVIAAGASAGEVVELRQTY